MANNKMIQKNNVKKKETDKNFLIVSDKTNKFFRDLKKKLRDKYNVSYNYNKIVEKMIKCVDMKKFEEELKRID